jgi:hypothetical protein
VRAKTFMTKQCHTMVTLEEISDRWHVALKQASNTLNATTQRYI